MSKYNCQRDHAEEERDAFKRREGKTPAKSQPLRVIEQYVQSVSNCG